MDKEILLKTRIDFAKEDKKVILVADDHEVNRKLICKILSEDYYTIEAENGEEAYHILSNNADIISAVMLDLMMPVMSGYEFLSAIYHHTAFENIPIIVTTGNSDYDNEIKALEAGAWDFVPKPYNAKIIKFRVKNAIERSQLTAFQQLKYLAEYDSLTDIYNKTKFFHETRVMLRLYPQNTYAFIRFDIERFQLINSFYGIEEGNKLIKYIGDQLKKNLDMDETCIYGRIEADIFGICLQYKREKELIDLINKGRILLSSYNLNYSITPTFGIYIIKDTHTPVDIMLDRASLAAKDCKGKYMKYYAFYNEKMSEGIIKEQEITNEMKTALEEEQFMIYLQPKYELQTNMLTGAEALVRWNHPRNGMIPPADFIPLFERNGFITSLDYYVWEKVCQYIRTWLDSGYKVFPISVNVSRVNLYNPNLIDSIIQLVKKYDIPPHLLNLELTESAYSDNPMVMSETMTKLQDYGFIIMMDDFGSGYSSLNVLKDIAVDVLKIDMKFLANTKIPGRGENIIASVIRMAKWLNIPVVAEGVETKLQIDFLRSIGCEYVQGYYFAHPMPVDRYETLLESNKVFQEIEKSTVSFDADSLWASNTQMEQLFNNSLQATAVYEFEDDHIEILRVNSVFYEVLGYKDISEKRYKPIELVNLDYRETVMDAFRRAISSNESVECEYLRNFSNGKIMWVHIRLKYISQIGKKYLVFGALTDISVQKEIDQELQRYKDALSDESNSTRTILIVDDIEVNRAILAEIFQQEYHILEAKNGKEALKVLKENHNQIDIILLDLVMPVMDGEEFLHRKQEIEEIEEIGSIPVIIITSEDHPEQQINTLALGANDYVVKPFIREIVIKRVHNVLESKRRFKEMLKEYHSVVQQAQTDSLTGIYNRATGKDMIDAILQKSIEEQSAMLMIDIDNFKEINDNYGHEQGDKILIAFAQCLSSSFRKGDVVARMGGDEFVVLISNISSRQFIEKKCNHIFQQALKIRAKDSTLNCSIGIGIAPKDGNSFSELYRNADSALYQAKKKGKNRYQFYGKE